MSERRARELLSREYYAARTGDTIGSALERLRASPPRANALYVYVVDDDGRLAGTVPVRRLLTSPPETLLASIMSTRLVRLPLDAPGSLVRDFFATYRFLALPVVDADGKLQGVVQLEDVAEVTFPEIEDEIEGRIRADVFHLLGVETEELRTRSAWRGARLRFPWLLVNVGGGLLAAFVAGLFEATVVERVALAFFVPVTLVLAESVAMQTVAIVVSGLKGGAPALRIGALAGRQVLEAALLGLGAGAVVAGAAWGWLGDPRLAGVLLSAIFLTCATAGGMGCALPLIFRRLGIDPALASAPLVLALGDNLTLLAYLSLAWVVLT